MGRCQNELRIREGKAHPFPALPTLPFVFRCYLRQSVGFKFISMHNQLLFFHTWRNLVLQSNAWSRSSTLRPLLHLAFLVKPFLPRAWDFLVSARTLSNSCSLFFLRLSCSRKSFASSFRNIWKTLKIVVKQAQSILHESWTHFWQSKTSLSVGNRYAAHLPSFEQGLFNF